jgi:hypothetical protein
MYTGYFTSGNEPSGIENAIHNTFLELTILILINKLTVLK